MENINQPINQNHDEVSVDTTQNLIDALNAHFSDNPTTYTAYRQKVELLLKEHIKPLSSRSAKSADGTDWKSQIKAQFSGRGAKWVFVSLAEIEDTLKEFEAQNLDCSDYRKYTSEQQKAWIRFSGPRLNNGKQCAAFEVRITGSTIDHPKQLHYIDIEVMDTVIEAMPGTPKALKLEEDSKPMPAAKKKEPKVEQPKEEEVKTDIAMLAADINDELANEVEEEVELNEPPQSDDPAEWEAFLAAEGLVDPDEEFESFDDDENFDSAFA